MCNLIFTSSYLNIKDLWRYTFNMKLSTDSELIHIVFRIKEGISNFNDYSIVFLLSLIK